MAAVPPPQIIEDLRFLHPPWEWWRAWQVWLALAAGAAVIVAIARFWMNTLARVRARRRRLAPCREALIAMRDLMGRWDPARPDLFAILFSGILRNYLEAMGAGPCSKLTAAEFAERLPAFDLLEEREIAWFASMASRCEPTKWAGRPMTKQDAERLVEEGSDHVHAITDRREARIAAKRQAVTDGAKTDFVGHAVSGEVLR